MAPCTQHWEAPAEAAAVARLRSAVAAFAATHGMAGTRLGDLRACVSEAITNAVVHGFADGRAPGTVTVSAEFRDSGLSVTVTDDGIGFAPRDDSPGLGLGMPTIRAFATTVQLSTPASGGTSVRMSFATDGAAEPQSASRFERAPSAPPVRRPR